MNTRIDDIKRMIETDKKFKTTIGGSALIEGIMMRGPEKLACVVRGADGFVVKEKTLTPPSQKHKILGFPFIRGIFNFIDSMKESMEALNFSADAIPLEETESKFDKWLTEKFGNAGVQKFVTAFAMVLGVALAMGLFVVLPTWLAGLIDTQWHLGGWRAAVEGIFRIFIFLCYLILISRMSDMKRVFAYHGAEHKTIHCYEAGEELTVDNVRRHTRMHPRCGTSFLLMVFIVGVLVFMWVPSPNLFIRVGLKLLLLPIVVGISYEINRYLGRTDHIISRIIRAPGLWLQNLTTREPDDSMIEVGIEALTLVLPAQKGADEWK